jgi:hypothetical protein
MGAIAALIILVVVVYFGAGAILLIGAATYFAATWVLILLTALIVGWAIYNFRTDSYSRRFPGDIIVPAVIALVFLWGIGGYARWPEIFHYIGSLFVRVTTR